MMTSYKKKLAVIAVFICVIIVLKSFAQQQEKPKEEDPKNLKVLPKNMSGEEVKNVMKVFSKSLGVKCEKCHVGTPQPGKPYPKFDFAADDKPEKNIARKMMIMTDSINTAFIDRMGIEDFEHISCVTCHMGNLKPMVSVDSLQRKM